MVTNIYKTIRATVPQVTDSYILNKYYSASNLSQRASIYNKSLSIKDSLVFPLMDSANNLSLYIKGNCS